MATWTVAEPPKTYRTVCAPLRLRRSIVGGRIRVYEIVAGQSGRYILNAAVQHDGKRRATSNTRGVVFFMAKDSRGRADTLL